MYPVRFSEAKDPNPKLTRVNRKEGESNADWIRRVAPGGQSRKNACVVLIGGNDIPHHRMRAAQSIARHDLSPSSWSHCVLLMRDSDPWETFEIALATTRPFGWPPLENAVQRGALDAFEYDDPGFFPNIATIDIPVAADRAREAVERFTQQPMAVDGTALLLEWLGYLWHGQEKPNPLKNGIGLPSAVLAETVIGTIWRDLTPGLASLASCPEAIWQGARHWHEYWSKASGGRKGQRSVSGAYTYPGQIVDKPENPGRSATNRSRGVVCAIDGKKATPTEPSGTNTAPSAVKSGSGLPARRRKPR